MSRFWNPKITRLVPYTPGEQPKNQALIKLNTNENPYGPSPRALEAIRAAANDRLRLYPDPDGTELRRAIASKFELEVDHIFLGNGSDEVLAHSFHAFFREGLPVLFADVTYGFYRAYCGLYSLRYREIPLGDAFEYVLQDFRVPCAGIVVANPNAPTGIAMPPASIEQILVQNPDVVVIVDEAYVDFGGESAVELVHRHENLVVIQTFSKSRSLAGLRVGFAIAQPHLIEALKRVKDSFNSYPIGRLSLEGALAAWRDRDWFDMTRRRVMADRKRMSDGLETQGFDVLPSAANFVFARHERARTETLMKGLRSRGILVRHLNQDRIRNWLRISVGTSEDCDRLLDATLSIVEGSTSGSA